MEPISPVQSISSVSPVSADGPRKSRQCHWHNLAKTENALAVWSGLGIEAFNHLQLWGCNEIMERCVHRSSIITAGCEWQQEQLNSSRLAAPPQLGHWQPAFTFPHPSLNTKKKNTTVRISEWSLYAGL